MVSIGKIEVYTDGSSLRNPGPSGLSYIIRYYEDVENGIPEAKEITGKQGFRLSTNNRMEIMAGIYALKEVLKKVDDGLFIDVRQVSLSSDSEYFCKAYNQNWLAKWQANGWMTSGYQSKKPHAVSNKDLWEKFLDILAEMKAKSITLIMTNVEGHAGDELNERCDQMAKEAADSTELLKDEEYEKLSKEYNH